MAEEVLGWKAKTSFEDLVDLMFEAELHNFKKNNPQV
jgi:GDP-D-mannose dehydratase